MLNIDSTVSHADWLLGLISVPPLLSVLNSLQACLWRREQILSLSWISDELIHICHFVICCPELDFRLAFLKADLSVEWNWDKKVPLPGGCPLQSRCWALHWHTSWNCCDLRYNTRTDKLHKRRRAGPQSDKGFCGPGSLIKLKQR
jgi:hypothetical protein